jgi:hypothetical protein
MHPQFSLSIFSSWGIKYRLAIPYQTVNKNGSPEHTEPIKVFLEENPSAPRQIQLPVHGFFADFPNNETKLNLFNERTICPGSLAAFQLTFTTLARIL